MSEASRCKLQLLAYLRVTLFLPEPLQKFAMPLLRFMCNPESKCLPNLNWLIRGTHWWRFIGLEQLLLGFARGIADRYWPLCCVQSWLWPDWSHNTEIIGKRFRSEFLKMDAQDCISFAVCANTSSLVLKQSSQTKLFRSSLSILMVIEELHKEFTWRADQT